MAGVPRYVGKLVLALLIACGTLASQSAWVTPDHTHGGAPEHCCAICHAGHLPIIAPVATVSVLPPVRLGWLQSSDECRHQLDALVVHRHSRAPPSITVL